MSQDWDEEEPSARESEEFDENFEKDLLSEDESDLDALVDSFLKEDGDKSHGDDIEKALRYAISEDRESKASMFRMRSGDVSEDHLNQPLPEAQNVEDEWVAQEKEVSSSRILFLSAVVVLLVITAGVIWAVIELRLGEEVAEKQQKQLVEHQEEVRKDEKKVVSIVEELELVARKYLSAQTVEEKLAIVRYPEKVRPMMVDYYQRHKMVPAQLREIHDISSFESNFRIFWVISCKMEDESRNQHLILAQSDNDEFSVVWEMDVVYQPMEWDEFIKNKPTETLGFRVYVEAAARDGFYGYEFSDYNKYRCFALRVEGSERMLWGYTLIGSETDKALVTEYRRLAKDEPSLENLSGYTLTLGLKYLPDSSTDKCVLIDSLISNDWKVE